MHHDEDTQRVDVQVHFVLEKDAIVNPIETNHGSGTRREVRHGQLGLADGRAAVQNSVSTGLIGPAEHRGVVLREIYAGVSEEPALQVFLRRPLGIRRDCDQSPGVGGYRIAGKTGTAWKARPEGGYGSKGDRDYVASFAGFLPAEDPRLAVIVIVDEPDIAHYSGGRAAAPIFARFAEFAVRRLRIPSESERVRFEGDERVQAMTAGRQRLLDEANRVATGDMIAASVGD